MSERKWSNVITPTTPLANKLSEFLNISFTKEFNEAELNITLDKEGKIQLTEENAVDILGNLEIVTRLQKHYPSFIKEFASELTLAQISKNLSSLTL